MTMSAHSACGVNPGKQLRVQNANGAWLCYAVKTRLVGSDDRLDELTETYLRPLVLPDDIIFISEKMLACTQGRALPLGQIKPGFWARLLSRFVSKTPGGIGLGIPQTMQCAINECGLARILLASAAGAVGRLLGQRGWFYHVAGVKAAAIDGPCHWTIPPYNQTVVLAPLNPNDAAAEVSRQLGGNIVLVADLNDFGGRVLGCSHPSTDTDALLELLSQNPLGQSDECTPMGILRPVPKFDTPVLADVRHTAAQQ